MMKKLTASSAQETQMPRSAMCADNSAPSPAPMAPDLAEGLHLHGTDKGHNGVGEGVGLLRQKANRKQQSDLR